MTETDPRRIEAQLERDRQALRATLDELRDRVFPDAMMRDGAGLLQKSALASARMAGSAAKANPLATALIGAGLVWMSMGRRKARKAKAAAAAEALPGWLQDASTLHQRATALQDDIQRLSQDAGLALDEIEASREDVRRALAEDLAITLNRGLEGLDAEERQAAFAVRQSRLATHLGLGPKKTAGPLAAMAGMGGTAVGGAVLAGAAAALTAYFSHRPAGTANGAAASGGASDPLMRSLQDSLDRARRDLADAMARLDARD